MFTLLEIIPKYGVLISKWGGLYYAFVHVLEVSINKIVLWKNLHVDDWTVEGRSLLVMMTIWNDCFKLSAKTTKLNR